MVDVALLFGRLLLLGLLYLFLFAAVRAGLGLVRSGAPSVADRPLGITVIAGPPELKGVSVELDHTVRIGRDPSLELVIADDFVSTEHARVVPGPSGPVLEDLESTNGTVLNGRPAAKPIVLAAGDVVEVGTVKMKVVKL